MTLDEERQERRKHLVSRCDMSIEDIKSEIDFILGQPKREWVDLSDEELSRLCFSKPNHPLTSNQVYGRILIAIQAFKEKNT